MEITDNGNMKKILVFLSAALLAAGCYPSYIRDFDGGSGVYTAYQYDLRTFVLGEGESFDFTVALGGVMDNTKDRPVKVVVDNSLLSLDLSTLSEGEYPSFTALDAILGSENGFGTVCQRYVSDEVRAAGLTSLTPLPESYYQISGLDGMTIRAGRHTAAATVTATEAIAEDPRAFAPYYALGFRILDADADELEPERSFEVIVVRCEHRFFGDWTLGGTTSVSDAAGNDLGSSSYEASQADEKVCTLTTVNASTVRANRLGQNPGRLLLTLNADNTITVASDDPAVTVSEIPGEPSTFNGAKLLQDRVINLNYKYVTGGYTYTVRDELRFRSRVRDGVLEWRDENPENYKK